MTLRLGSPAQTDLRRALRRGHGATVFVDLTATDAASNTTRVRPRLVLRYTRARLRRLVGTRIPILRC